MTEQTQCVVVGGGVIGLAIARALALQGRETVVLESEPDIGRGISSRSSEVIHSGIYYPAGSLKARLCVRGRELLYGYCRERSIWHSACGKLIVAIGGGQLGPLQTLRAVGAANGVHDLRWLSADQAAALEPALSCEAALLCPSTGVIDSHGLMLALRADVESAGGVVVCSARVLGGQCEAGGIRLRVAGGAEFEIRARIVINAAGLGAQSLAHALAPVPPESIPPLYYAKGSYFMLRGQAPFSRLIYPLPEVGGLGVHLTLDNAGRARFGPDVEWISQPEYSVSAGRIDSFYAAIRRYWPTLADGSLQEGYAGVRPKLHPPGTSFADFAIQGHSVHGIRGLVSLYGMESPGLTASLAIAEHVCDLIG